MFREPNTIERSQQNELIGKRIEIYWDGDDIYYQANIISYDYQTNKHIVIYENDETLDEYDEDLSDPMCIWKVWDDDNEASNQSNNNSNSKSNSNANSKSDIKMSYSNMVVEAVCQLGEKNGSSLQSIRKYILTNFSLRNQQIASFNSLTLKAVNKAVAQGELDRYKHHYKLSNYEKEKRKIKDKKGINNRDSFSYYPKQFSTALDNNKALKKVWELSIRRRDNYLRQRIQILEPFLGEQRKKRLDEESTSYHSDKPDETDNNKESNDFDQLDEKLDKKIYSETDNNLDSKIESKIDSSIDNDPDTKIVSQLHDSLDRSIDDSIDRSLEVNDALAQEILTFQNNELEEITLLDQPKDLIANLHDYQLQGISWMTYMFQRGMPMILADQMGLGKTLQAIGFLCAIQQYCNQCGPYLIVVPLSVLSNWMSEIERFCPTLRAVRFHGPKNERERIKTEELIDLSDFDIVITTFEMLVAEANYFRRKYVWTCVIVDEGHRLKNDKSQLSEKLKSVPTICKVILTGTPLQNNLRELWSLLHFLSPDIFPTNSSEYFDDGFDLLRHKIDLETLRNTRKLLGVFMLRRLKENVNIHLPDKKEITLLVPLTNSQIDWYKRLLGGMDESLIDKVMRVDSDQDAKETIDSAIDDKVVESNGNQSNDWRKLMNLLIQLRKVCNHVNLMPDELDNESVISNELSNLIDGSGKLVILDRMLSRLQEDSHRVLLFSQFTSMLDILEEYCDLKQYSYVRLDGQTNRVQRRLDVRRFNAIGSSIFIFLISTRAGGLGINLASADTVILYDSDWNPQVDLQAMERAHRIGQTKPVRIFRLICRGSVEERMISRADKKLFLNAIVAENDPDADVEDDREANAFGINGSSISKRELASLIRFGANAIIDSTNNSQSISDVELDQILERNGRSNELVVKDDNVLIGNQSEQLIDNRIDRFKEIDIRQLGDVYYKKADKSGDLSANHESNELHINSKRKRIERIQLVDGRGSGYGSSIPILKNNIENEIIQSNDLKHKERIWKHLEFCSLCGKRNHSSDLIKCGHCPRIFHSKCLSNNNINKTTSVFICPHHKCSGCNRSTSSAGGLLFRCTDCLTAYCEDCLPSDEIEGIGRFALYETLGYRSKQAYFIKCSYCSSDHVVDCNNLISDKVIDNIITNKGKDIHENGENGSVIDTDVNEIDKDKDEDNEENKEDKDLDKEEDKEDVSFNDTNQLLPTQLIRLHNEEIYEPIINKKQSPTKRLKSNYQSNSIDVTIDIEDTDFNVDMNISDKSSLNEAIDILQNHPISNKFQLFSYIHSPSDIWSNILNKVYSSRYRSLSAFIYDIKSYFNTYLSNISKQIKKLLKNEIIEDDESGSIDDVMRSLKQYEYVIRKLLDYFNDVITSKLQL